MVDFHLAILFVRIVFDHCIWMIIFVCFNYHFVFHIKDNLPNCSFGIVITTVITIFQIYIRATSVRHPRI